MSRANGCSQFVFCVLRCACVFLLLPDLCVNFSFHLCLIEIQCLIGRKTKHEHYILSIEPHMHMVKQESLVLYHTSVNYSTTHSNLYTNSSLLWRTIEYKSSCNPTDYFGKTKVRLPDLCCLCCACNQSPLIRHRMQQKQQQSIS